MRGLDGRAGGARRGSGSMIITRFHFLALEKSEEIISPAAGFFHFTEIFDDEVSV